MDMTGTWILHKVKYQYDMTWYVAYFEVPGIIAQRYTKQGNTLGTLL